MAEHGANIVRIRLWHTPDWEAMDGTVNQFSNFADAKISIARAKALGLNVLLDFHYSDEWTDPGHQTIPSAWESLINDTPALTSTVYDYTYDTLMSLNADGLMPEYVQVGNETNREIMMLDGSTGFPIDWARNSALLNAGINAVRAAGEASSIDPKIILHIADPNNAVWWFGDATQNGVIDFDIIGLSYYPEWHPGTITQTGDIITNLKTTFNKDVMIVETGVIWTHDWNDNGTNMMGSEQYYTSEGYGVASPEAQRDWLIDLSNEVKTRGGLGVVYWEPSWVSTGCWTMYGLHNPSN
ncbi:MAG: glycosyl hydrolase 53 family protein [Thalassotalea sp.]|nr:glycosyl hydrolase 53 family protein [Thalassotalea sp.]MDG2392336.1 glycosyl hydrolase 53 family protein [Thalassotalea sp.]